MLRNPRRMAPTLLALLFGLLAAAAAHAEPAPAASSTSADCLAKPNGPSAPGKHWFYHLDRASGRHCWYQRPEIAAQNESGQARAMPPRLKLSAPIDQPAPETPPETPIDDADRNTSPAVAAPPPQPYSWSTAAPAPTPRVDVIAATSDGAPAAAAPTVAPRTEQPVEPPRAEPPAARPVPAPVRMATAERPAAVSDEAAHVPAVLGAAFALLVIILGSSAARLGAKLLRSRRRRGVVDPPLTNEGPPIHRAEDAPDLVPHMPGDGDPVRDAHLPRAPTFAGTTPRDEPDPGSDVTGPNRDSARVLEENVRALLRRLQHDLQAQPRAVPVSVPSPRSAVEELDEVLAKWRARKRGAGTA